MEKLLISRTADINDTLNDYKQIKAEIAQHDSASEVKQQRIHVENQNEFGRRYKGKLLYHRITLLLKFNLYRYPKGKYSKKLETLT